MQKNALFKIQLLSTTENGKELIEHTADGLCVVEENGVMVTYPEPENEGHTQLIITHELADLQRKGQTQSRMTFIEQRMLPCQYTTPHGPINMSIYTHQHAFALNAEGGRFVAHYTVMVDGGHVADNELTIEWTF